MFISRRGYPYRDESMLMRERFCHLLYLFPSIVVSFLPLFLFLPLSVTLIARRAFSHLSTFDNRDRRGETACSLARSLSRALAHPTVIRLAIVAHETSPIAKSNIRRCTAASTDDLVFPLHKRTKPYRTSRTNARTADTDPAVKNHKCSLGSACMRLLSSYKMYTIHSHTRTHTCPRARTQARTCTHTYIPYIHIWAHVKTMSLGSYYLHPRTKAHNRMTK